MPCGLSSVSTILLSHTAAESVYYKHVTIRLALLSGDLETSLRVDSGVDIARSAAILRVSCPHNTPLKASRKFR